jgi:hypothetical protein
MGTNFLHERFKLQKKTNNKRAFLDIAFQQFIFIILAQRLSAGYWHVIIRGKFSVDFGDTSPLPSTVLLSNPYGTVPS